MGKPSPRLRLMPTMVIIMDMASPITGTVMLTTAIMATLTPIMATMARGPLMPSQRPMLSTVITVMASPTTGTDMAWLITAITATLMLTTTDTTTAREGLLMLSPLLTHSTDITIDMLHTVMLTGVTTATPMLTMVTTATTTESKLSYCYFVQELRSSLCEMGCS